MSVRIIPVVLAVAFTAGTALAGSDGSPPVGDRPPDQNDTCAGAYEILRCSTGTVSGDMTGDANDYDPGAGGCASGYPEAGLDVTFRMDLEAGDQADLYYHTPGLDAAFYIVTDCSDPAGSCVVGADAAFDTETIHWIAPTAGVYYVILDHYGAGQGAGPWSLDFVMPNCPPPFGACCFADGSCRMLTAEACAAAQGAWLGEGYACEPENPCDATPTEPQSWGRIKHRYR